MDAALCTTAARQAATETGVPLSVLMAVTLTETGRNTAGRMDPWPWTVNMEGEGHWFEDEDAARAFVYDRYKSGARSFDIGCFQINHRWHGENFASVAEMFRPDKNALYAAEFLGQLYDEFGDWSAAAGAFHSRTQQFAKAYRARFDAIRSDLPDGLGTGIAQRSAQPSLAGVPERVARSEQVNTYPLLQSRGRPGSPGSLFQVSSGG